MTINEFRCSFRTLLNSAARSGLDVDDLIEAAESELHPDFDMADLVAEQRQ